MLNDKQRGEGSFGNEGLIAEDTEAEQEKGVQNK